MTVSPSQADQHFQRAMALHRHGRIAEADRLYAEILSHRPDHLVALQMSGIAALQAQDFERGLGLLTRAVHIDAGSASLHHNLGVALENLARPQEALASYDRALAIDPGYAAAWFNRGNVLTGLRRFEAAIASFDQAIAVDADYGDAYFNRGNALTALGRLDAAIASYDHALISNPASADLHFSRAEALRRLNRLPQALAGYDLAIKADPAGGEAYFHRGAVLMALQRVDEAIDSYRQALVLQPDAPAIHNDLGVALSGVNRFAALQSYERALVLQPDYPEALNNRGNVLRELLRPLEALASYDKALALKRDYAEAHENRGLVLIELGRLDEAVVAIETSIQIAPMRVRAYYSLAESKRFAPGDPAIAAMEDLARGAPSLSALEQTHLNFALGKAFADLGATEPSFTYLLVGNRLKRDTLRYDEAAALEDLDRTRRAFTADWVRGHEGGGDPAHTPVFIVGMPRSGSTLVEQILASHPAVFGGGERVDFAQALAAFGDGPDAPLNAPDAAAGLTPPQLKALGGDYLNRIRAAAPDAERITDKSLDNFRHLGLIHAALPNARILHARRDPIDTCVSCFSKLFTGDVPYAYDLAELGRYYRAYEAVMDHWRRVLPAGVMLEVRYEALVADTEGEARRLVDHCGLPWDPACLDFHRNERSVRTASVVQVRQPVFSSSVGRWRAYRSFLQPLFDGLGYTPAA